MAALLTPEMEELERKNAELDDLCRELAERELELQTLRAELAAFGARYVRIVVRRLAELDQLKAEIAEERARRAPRSRKARAAAETARERAHESSEAVGNANPDTETERESRTVPSDDLKRRYREAAKTLHPDLCTDPNDRAVRSTFMAKVNQAYQDGDLEAVEEILHEWSCHPEAVSGDGVGSDLVRAIRRIAQVKARIEEITDEIGELQESQWYELMREVATANTNGRDVLEEMAAHLDEEIAETRDALRRMKRPDTGHQPPGVGEPKP